MSNNIVRAIKAINPDAEFSFFGEDLDTIQWSKGTTPISKADSDKTETFRFDIGTTF